MGNEDCTNKHSYQLLIKIRMQTNLMPKPQHNLCIKLVCFKVAVSEEF